MSHMLTVTEAATTIMQSLFAPSIIKKPLEDAFGYCLAANITAERDHPPFNRITHDGIAIFYGSYLKGQREFTIEAYAAAGSPACILSDSTHAIEVATGAPLPEGCNTVIPYEFFSLNDSIATLNSAAIIEYGNALHEQGKDAEKGQVLLKTGRSIGIPEIAVLAANGVSNAPVYAKPSISILATGDELVDIDAPIEPFQIRRSNDATLKAALRINGFDDVETAAVPDNIEALQSHIRACLANKNVVLITGGVSRGARDYVPQMLKSVGTKEIFHHVAQCPGKPLWFGKKENTLVFALPGNPNSALTCLVRYVIPALKAISGNVFNSPTKKILAKPMQPHPTLTLFAPVQLEENTVILMTTHTSGDFTGLLGSAGFVEVPSGTQSFVSGDKVDFYPWAPS